MRVIDGGSEQQEPRRPTAPRRRTAKLSEVVAREIVNDIGARRLGPLTMLPAESVMLEQFGVGRASLREALRVLEVQGLIVIKPGPGGGPMVAGVSSQHFGRMATLFFHLCDATFGDLVQARLVIEPVMARLAAQRHAPDDLAWLEAFVASPEPRQASGSDYFRIGTEFHFKLSSMSGNPVLELFAQSIKEIYTARQHGVTFPEEARDRVVVDHVAIAEAILGGEAEQAERLMRKHMEEFTEYSAIRYPGMMEEVVDWL